MKKILFIAVLVLFSGLLLAQEQEQAQVEPQVQPLPLPQAKNLKQIGFPQAFIHAGKEYPAGIYWLLVTMKDGQPLFAVHNAQKELLFEELAIAKAKAAIQIGPSVRLKKEFMKNREYFRITAFTSGQKLLGYFLVKQ